MSCKKKQASEYCDGADWDMRSVSHFRELVTSSNPDGHNDHVAKEESGDFSAKEDGNG